MCVALTPLDHMRFRTRSHSCTHRLTLILLTRLPLTSRSQAVEASEPHIPPHSQDTAR